MGRVKSINRLEWLDLFRGLAAGVVVLYHYRDVLGLPAGFYGFLAVDAFFVLSGIVLGLRYTSAIEDGMSFMAFASARLRRLYPMVFIAGAFTFVIDLTMGRPIGFSLLSAFLVLPALDAKAYLAFPTNVPEWSLWAELAANVVWFAVLRNGGRRAMPWVGLAAMAVTLVLARHGGTVDVGFRSGALSCLEGLARAFAWFSVGYGLARGALDRLVSPWLLVAVSAVSAAASAVVLHRAWIDQVLIIATLASLLRALCLAPPPGPRVALVARWLGMASFPMYLVHVPCKQLLPLLGAFPSWASVALIVVSATILATILNERLVAVAQSLPRRPMTRRRNDAADVG